MSKLVFPIPLETTVENQGTDYIDQKVMDGDYFNGFITRISTVPETIYRVIKTGSLPLIIENILTDIDYSSISDGEYSLTTRVYIDISNGNDWSYSGGIPSKIGRPLNAELINKTPSFDLISAPTVDTLTGEPDFVLSFSQYYRDSSGNRDTLVGVNNNFFGDGRKLIIPANSEVLAETITGGDNGNSGGIRTFIDFIEPGEY